MELTTRIKETKLLEYQESIVNRIIKIANYVFRNEIKLKFAGFLLYGPPGNGKTEIAKQAAKRIKDANPAKILLVDGSDIASPRWGDAEEKLKKIFLGEANGEKRIIIFDDIESTLMSRDVEIAKEWHFSINSVVFHFLDDINHSDTIVIATTNKKEMVDPALISRLYPISVNLLSKPQLKQFLLDLLKDEDYGIDTFEIEKTIASKIEAGTVMSLRDIEHEILLEVVDKIGE